MKYFKYLLIVAIVSSIGCKEEEYLDVKPTDMVSKNDLFSREEGRNKFIANMYSQLPIEDFKSTTGGFNFTGNNVGMYAPCIYDDGMNSEYETSPQSPYSWWDNGYEFNRDINLFFSYIPELDVDQEAKEELLGQAYFMRAFTYYALAKRYGGVPIITSIANIADSSALYVPRSTEKKTWDFVLATCDSAAMYLGEGDGTRRRASKWTALALKSRAALHAASVAKYWDRASLSGDAVNAGLVGMDAEVADEYYGECISASERIMDEGPFSLYKPSPASPEEAGENYRSMFDDPNVALNEVILIEGYDQVGHGHGWNNWAQPAQTAGTWPHTGRMNASLNLVDTYPTYSNPDESFPIVTTVDGNYNNYEGYDPDREYLTFDSPADIFEGKDARLFGSVILPFTTWKDTKIIIQGGYIKPDGTAVIEAADQTTVNGKTYCTYGACTAGQYSGFSVSPNTTRTGFLIKKTLDKEFVPTTSLTRATNDWIAIRYAEILLNYAEAVVESGQGSATKAAEALNDIRQRASHQNEISLTLENVLRERRIELVYENKRYWDLCRRRESHTKFDNYQKKALVPVLDLRNMKYIFIRKYAVKSVPLNYMSMGYYSPIPGIASNKLTQNPQY